MSAQAALLERLFPREQLRQRFLARVRRKRGSVSLPFRFEYRNIYVLPTAFGLAFGLMLTFMALGGLNFNNNMALLLVFIFGVIAQLTTVLAYRNLVGLRVESIRSDPVFCGEAARFRVYLGNIEERPRLTIRAGFREIQDCVDVADNHTEQVVLEQATGIRGWLPMAPFRLETRYPLGLFKAWTWFFPEHRCLVYPAPAKNPPPLPRQGSGLGGQARKGEGEQVHGLRQYRTGDPLRRVAWRTSARHDQLYTREMESPRDDACEINWENLPGVSVEARISLLTAWVLMADHHQVEYSLVLPGTHIPAGLGNEHRNRCLEALALFGK
ncbi:MAG: DUF58 domain-containing protein [Xanthomonadales bacterium]|nr:DUF58 domain-containing protein [Xanthomonadales bacterium]